MKLICKQDSLSSAVTNVQRAVSTKTTMPALEGILLRAE
ncbi:MAG: DNA polymerase III subunit beta, partial [Acutalibacteraceae bacterium]